MYATELESERASARAEVAGAIPVSLRRPCAPIPAPERETLFRDFQPLVRRLIRQYGEDPEMRQDLQGEIYCRFCDLIDQYDPSRGIPLRAYVVRNLTSSVYTFSRSCWRLRARETPMSLPETAPATGTDPTRHWDHRIHLGSVMDALPAAIEALPPRQQKVVIWRYYEGWSFEQIAGRLHIQPATARSLLRHALNNLRRWAAGSALVGDNEE